MSNPSKHTKHKKTLLLTLLTAPLYLMSQAALAGETIKIPSGDFLMGCSKTDKDCDVDEGPSGGTAVFVPVFTIDRSEVTVKQYQQCIKAGVCTRPKDFNRNKYCNLGHAKRGDHPANCVDWSQAVSYCKFKGGRLPYEAEWEKAARANSKTRYPWGNEVSCKNAILDDGKTMGSVPDEPDGCGEDRTWPINSRTANDYKLFDMHGNVGEWTNNWYSKTAITSLYAKKDLKGPQKGVRRVVRGGSWDENMLNLRSSFRNVKDPVSGDSVYGSIGFRCAYE